MMTAHIILMIILFFIVYDLLKRHLEEKEKLFIKQFNYKKYGEILFDIEGIMSSIVNLVKVQLSLCISQKLINDSTQQVYIDRINNDIRIHKICLEQKTKQLKTYTCNAFSITPYVRELINNYCIEIEKNLNEHSLHLFYNIEMAITNVDNEELSGVHLKLSEAAVVGYNYWVDIAYKKYQDLCEELLNA